MAIRVKISKERLDALRGQKDFWSEVAFAPGYTMAPTYTPEDVDELEATMTLDSSLVGMVGWMIPLSTDPGWSMADVCVDLQALVVTVDAMNTPRYFGLPTEQTAELKEAA